VHVVTLRDPSSSVVAQYVPSAGMIGVSLTDSDQQLLGQRRGLDAYIEAGKTMGIPMLYPWANRLGDRNYTVGDDEVTLRSDAAGVRFDPNGLPIHGLLAGYGGWQVMAESANELTAELNFADDPALLASFPFPHMLVVRVSLADRILTVRSTVSAVGDRPVPLCYGFHPYLQLPDTPRAQWVIDTPRLRHLILDEQGLPTGETTEQPPIHGPLGDRGFDDGYDQVPEGSVFAVSGGQRRIEVHFDEGYPAAQIFAPPGEDVVCFEPMAAPTDALRRGGYRFARPGEPAVAVFSIHV
jgi:aldose 1-epimerase